MNVCLGRRKSISLVVIITLCVVGLATSSGTDRPPTDVPDRATVHVGDHGTNQADRVETQVALDFARVVVVGLHGYDTRAPRGPWRRALLAALGTPEASRGALDVDRLILDAAQWAQMAAVGQSASVTIGSVYVPALWEQTVREHPELPEGAIGFTVTGTQVVSWDGGTSRVPVAVTVLLLCPPATEHCVVSRIPAQVAR